MKLLSQFIFASFILGICWSCDSSSGNATESAEKNAADTAIIELAEEAAPAKPVLKRGQNIPFEKTIKEGNISFTITSPNVPDRNTMVIFSKGLEVRNDTFQIEADGHVKDAQLADINTDGFPEVYVFTEQPDNKQKGGVIVFTSYRNRSYGQAFIRELPNAATLMPDTSAVDYFALEDGQLVRKVAAASEGENATARQAKSIVYELKSGEASYQLVPKRGE